MIKKLFLFFSILTGLSLFTPLLSAQVVRPLDEACKDNSDATLCKDNQDTKDDTHSNNSIYGPDGILTKATSIISIMVGVAAIIVVIVAALRYSLSSGDPANVNKARNTIIYALVGLAVAAAAQGIVIFVLNKL